MGCTHALPLKTKIPPPSRSAVWHPDQIVKKLTWVGWLAVVAVVHDQARLAVAVVLAPRQMLDGVVAEEMLRAWMDAKKE